jgi:hypothetical protein
MSSYLKFTALFLLMASCYSCRPKPKVVEVKEVNEVQEVKKDSDTILVTPVNSVTDDIASFISGTPYGKSGCLAKYDSLIKWNLYAKELDKLFANANSLRLEKMKSWTSTEIKKDQITTTVFYPFSGPDFLNANIFYPDADRYIMIAQEPIGHLPDICSMHPDSVKSYLNSINNSMKDIFKRSYFITSKMNDDLKKTKVNGTVPLLSLFIKRTGHQIVSIQKIAVDSGGYLQILDSLKTKSKIVQGVRIDIRSASEKKIQSVYYFRTDISDKGLEKNPGFKSWLSKLPQSNTYLKAGSYLMHFEEFREIRSIIFNLSLTILQDDSGIAYKYFDKAKWNINLYGVYVKPKDEFKYIDEPDLAKAYKSPDIKPLSYSVGYNWRTGKSNLLYAIRK